VALIIVVTRASVVVIVVCEKKIGAKKNDKCDKN